MRTPPPSDAPDDLAALAKREHAHKYSYGHVLVLAGPPGHGGAARLAARGALRIGAGLVTLACPPAALTENAAQLTAVMTRPFDSAREMRKILTDQRISTICLGPGLGLGEATRDLVSVALGSGKPCVLDADALGAFARHAPRFFDMLHGDCVLTPHAGEFSRLFPDLGLDEAKDEAAENNARACAVRKAAARAGSTVLLKGATTLIATEAGQIERLSATGANAAPWLATAGSGDVLAGFIAGLLARGFAPLRAAHTGAWLHAQAARSFGPGLIAEDLPDELPRVFRALGIQGADP